MKLQLFDGGAATRLAPQLINVNQGVVYENIDNAQGILTPNKDKDITTIEVERYQEYFNAEDEWLSSATLTDYLEFQQVMYLTDRITQPQKYKNGVFNNLGIEAPTQKPTLSLVEEADPNIQFLAVNKTDVVGADLPASDLSYLLFNINGGVYSRPYAFTIFGSTTTATRAQGEFPTEDSIFGTGIVFGNPITTEEITGDRAILFAEFFGDFPDELALFRWYDGAWRRLFITSSVGPGFQFTDQVYDISASVELDTSLITAFNGTYQYVYTYYNSSDGTESAPSPVSDELVATSGQIFVNNIQTSSDPQVDFRRVYRVGGSITQFTLVAEIPNDVISGFTDSVRDADLPGDLLVSDNYQPAPIGLKFLSEAYAMLFGALGNSLRFTPIGVPNAWPPEFELQFDEEITGIGPVANGVLVFTEARTFIVTGTGPTTLAQQLLRGDQGCIAFESIQEAYEGTLIWASKDGLCTSSGNDVRSLTKNSLGEISLTPVSSAVNDEIYYCHNADGSTLAWDYRFNQIPKFLNLDVEALNTALGVLYGYKEGFLYTLFTSDNNLTLRYTSPRFVEGLYTANKTYKKLFVRAEGQLTVQVLLNDTLVATFSVSGTDTYQFQIPQQQQRGYSIQFSVEGTGTIQEMEYEAEPRKMANQSLVSVPPNVENPRVLQRFLTRLVEQLDVVLGNRANEGYVSQEELVAQAQSLTETIVAAEQQLQTVLDRLENTTEIDIENLNNRISSLESTTASQGDTLDVLENVTPVKIVTLSFTANGLGDPVLLLDYNIATSSKVGVGLYEFTINQSVFNGANALDNSVISTYYNMVSSTDLFIIEYTTINATTFRIQVIEQTAGAYDITVNDVVDVMAFMDIPGTFLPPEF